ncbi:MAG: Lrp/AsnC family transcriptional regulator [Candidatus Aminicenantes bacterium]|nr:Lrp/AsnC family transcriptional regulator [Candidatus Aminicenantes bacterium]
MIDDISKKIIDCLSRDARKSFREVAKEIGTSVTAVINAVKNMESKGVIRGYIPVVDSVSVGYDLSAAVAIRISQGKILEMQKKIAEDPRVFAVYDITGEWDCLVLARFRGRDDLNRFIKKINSLPHIDRTVTHLVLNTVKEERRVFP